MKEDDFDSLHQLPNWDEFNRFREEDETTGWKNEPKQERARNLFNQARNVYRYSALLCEALKGEMAEMVKGLIMQNATMLCPKILGAEGGNTYIIRMENASIIRTNARELEIQVKAAAIYENCKEDDKNIVVEEIVKFRELFKEWVKNFERDEFDDEWGLYNY